MNQRRKEKLNRRATQYAAARIEYIGPEGNITELENAYKRGYRDAMKDARRAYDSQHNHRTFALDEFLRPLR